MAPVFMGNFDRFFHVFPSPQAISVASPRDVTARTKLKIELV
jgi:hypothetical protein